MFSAPKTSVTYDPALQIFTHFGGGHWKQSYPIARLAERLAFYRKLREDHPKSGSAYDAAILAHEALVKELGLEV